MNKQVPVSSKHKDLKLNFIKAAIRRELIVLHNVASKYNSADVLTKILALPVMNYLSGTIYFGKQRFEHLSPFNLSMNQLVIKNPSTNF